MGKAVQHFFTLTDTVDRGPVVLLVQEKSGLLPILYIHQIAHSILQYFHLGIKGFPDKSLAADQAIENAALNGLQDRVRFQCADVFELLPRLESRGESYDVVILDPPAFTKSRSSVKNAVKGYREINLRGLKLVRDGGYLATCSCSHFMEPELFAKTIREAAAGARKRLRQVEFRTQGADHPILWAADQSYYLKFYIFQVVNER